MSMILALKLTLVPLLIGCITLAGRKWGPAVAGWLSGFPVVAGPILLFIALEHGAAFAKAAASSTLLSIVAALVFVMSYAWIAMKHSWQLSLAGGFISYFISIYFLHFFVPPLSLTLAIVVASLLVAPYCLPSIKLDNMATLSAPQKTPNDMLIRMVAGALLVLLVTHFSSQMGQHLSGFFAMFPVMVSVLSVFSHRQSGNAFAIHFLRGTLRGYYACAGFYVMLAWLLPSLNLTFSFLAAFASAAVIQLLSLATITPYSSIKTENSNRI